MTAADSNGINAISDAATTSGRLRGRRSLWIHVQRREIAAVSARGTRSCVQRANGHAVSPPVCGGVYDAFDPAKAPRNEAPC